MVIFINYFQSKCECLYTEEDCTVDSILEHVKTKGYPKDIVKIIYNGRYVDTHHLVKNNSTIHVVLSLCGGKGGFGSMLRAIGAQIEKTTNREACRDLSGRRLRDINEEQRLKRWITKKAEREREVAERRRRKLEQMCSLPKHDFHDAQYDRERRDLTERIDDSLAHGLKEATGSKRKLDDDLPSSKKGCLWIDMNVTEEEEGEQSANDIVCSDEGSNSFASTSEETDSSRDKITEEPQCTNNDNDTICKISGVSSTLQIASENTSKQDNKERDSTVEAPSMDLLQSQEIDVKKSTDTKPLDLLSFQSAKELEQLGLERLKLALQHLGMKCGGTLQQRAERLWLVQGVDPSKISPNLLAKPSKSKK